MTTLHIVSALVATYMCFVQGPCNHQQWKTLVKKYMLITMRHDSLMLKESPCLTPNGVTGQCININECKDLLAILDNPQRSKEEVELLRRSHCGFADKVPMVCCPQLTPPLDRRCFTYEGKEGTCLGLYSCPLLMGLLKPPVSKDNLSYVQLSRCESPDRYSVCCGPDEAVPPAPGKQAMCTLTAAPPDPRTECCGLDSGGGNRIFGGNVTAIDQYPWLTLIEYRGVRDDRIKLLCGGALISGQYVLTAAHCVVGPVLNSGTPINVRLGEYDVSFSGRDCVQVEGGGTDCTDPVVTIPIERTIPHKDYNPSAKLRRNDIALLRLAQMAPYTDFIRPICLPNMDITLNTMTNIRLEVAGWGAISDTESFSNLKLHVDLPLATKQQCEPYYAQRQVPLWDGQICAGGEKGKDSCKGDSGGPLMNENGKVWEVVGVVSFGPTPCGMENIPGVYTKVYDYLPWIRTQMKP
ncbi:phenoloxidase-activating enzyme-like isoform X1 [Pieris napi]|uniref:phenoloxidase-activating enzyme-like isoform X1 n=1 Tax=Pieris napi TaxID=78633 RepID=UPI001FB89460|nr:phenoloxidase-activating enzyme-like isoform X1 [Pieris napi]